MPQNNSGAGRRTIIATPEAPAAVGPYSQAVLAGGTLYCSGQIPLDPATNELVSGTIAQETERVLMNLGAVLRAAGLDYADVVRCVVYLTDMNDFAEMNGVYAKFFPENQPAREAIAVRALPKGARVEISCIALA